MTEYYSRVDYTYSSGSANFSIPFSYIDKEHIKVFINDEETQNYTYLTSSQIQISDTLSSGDLVSIVRTTPINERMVEFTDTSILNEDTQNLAHEQMFDVVQEVYDSLNAHKEDVETLKPYIETAANNIEHIINVDENMTDINTISSNISNVNTVSGNISNINSVANNETNINTAVSNISNINSVASNIENINSVNSNKTNIDITANNLNAINTVSNSINGVNTVAGDISNVNAVAQNLNIIDDLSAELDRIDQSKGKESGTVSNNADILADIKSYAHSSFDVSKFTKVGSPTITNEGIYTSTNEYGTNYLGFSNITASNNLKLNFEFSLTGYYDGFFINTINDINSGAYLGEYNGFTWNNLGIIDLGGYHYFEAGHSYKSYLYFKSDNTVEVGFKKDNESSYIVGNGTYSTLPSAFYFGFRYNNSGNAIFDLTKVSVISNGVEVFSGNKTGTDTYTINGSTVTIPYTLSKTGSKIVDSAYRTQVASVYNTYGVSPYYTLDETNGNFTLPMGEVYGMIERKADRDLANLDTAGQAVINGKADVDLSNTTPVQSFINNSIKWGMPDYSSGVSKTSGTSYTATESGWLEVLSSDYNVTTTITIDGTTRYIGTSANQLSVNDTIFPVSKNSTYTVTLGRLDYSSITFYPCKGGN